MRQNYLAVLLILVVLLVSVSPAAAATTTFSYSLSTSSSSFIDELDIGCVFIDSNDLFYYRTTRFQVTEDGEYFFTDLFDTEDGFLHIYDGSFDSDNLTANCIYAIDDNQPVTLQAGRSYTMVQTTFSAEGTGTFAYSVTGPGDLVFGSGSADGVVAGPPCENLFDGRINDNQSLDCAAPVAIYLVDGRVDVYAVDPNSGEGSLVISSSGAAAEATAEPDAVEASGNILLGSSGNIRLYWLPATGEYLLQATYADGKPYEVVWSGDGTDLRHTAA